MTTPFYRAWLPVSLAVHLAVMLFLYIMPFGAPALGGNQNYYQVEILPAGIIPVESKPQPDLPQNTPPTLPEGSQTTNPDIRNNVFGNPGSDQKHDGVGPGTNPTPTAPVKQMTSSKGEGSAAPGKPNSAGITPGAPPGPPAGASSGAEVTFGVRKAHDKIVGDLIESRDASFRVDLDVPVSASGAVGAPVVVRSSSIPELDARARSLVQANIKSSKSRLINGALTDGAVRVRITFTNDIYEVSKL